MEHKYRYYLNGVLYFIFLTEQEKQLFEDRYNVSLFLAT